MQKRTIPKPASTSKLPQTVTARRPEIKSHKLPETPRGLTRDWTLLDKDLAICSGNYSHSHKKFKGHNEQGTAACALACAISWLIPINQWSKSTLDKILEIGANLQAKTRTSTDAKCATNIEPHQLYKYFFLEDLRISLRISTDVVTARIPRDSSIVQNIENLLKKFFNLNIGGVFSCQQTYFAIWKDKYFFVFDPRDHNLEGGKWMGVPGLGYCYCIRSNNLARIADIIVKNIPLKQVNKFTIYPITVEKVVKVNTIPPQTLDEKPIIPPPPVENFNVVKKSRLVQPAVPPPKEKQPPKLKPKEPEKKEEPVPVKPVGSKTSQASAGSKTSAGSKASVISKKESVISKSRIPPERPKLQSVTNFQDLQPGKSGILRGITHQCDPKFTRYMGAQSLANAVAALTMLRQYKSKNWVRSIINSILQLGEVIHHDSKNLPNGQIAKKVTLKEKDYHPKIEKFGSIGRLQTDTDRILDLEQALTNFLIDNDCCILHGPIVLAIWKEDNRFYMFDPNERDAKGKVVKDEPGFACVSWFTVLKDLVNLYMENVPVPNRKDRFILSKVVINDYVPVSEDWYNFTALTFNKWILRGSFSQRDRRFPEETRNSQCTANATMALTYKELKEEKEWDSNTVDQVLLSGNDLYQSCIDYLKENNKFKDKYLMVDEVKRTFDVENKRVNLEIDDCLVNGVLNAKSETGIPNLKRGFEEFFTTNDAGIITANLQSMAVWRKDEVFYYYDSHSRNEKGVVCGYGTACILRLVTIDDLTNALMRNLLADRNNFYNISRIVVNLMDLTEGGAAIPPLLKYEAISDLISILRAGFSQNDKRFYINAGKQTVPNCIAALAMNNLIPSNDWTQEDLEEVLVLGDKLYSDSMEDNYAEDVPEDKNVDEITIDNVKRELKIGSNAFYLDFDPLTQGTLDENFTEGLQNLYQFSQNEDCNSFQAIFDSQYMTASIWRDDNLFYLFDPKPRDEKGGIYGKDDWTLREESLESAEDEEEGSSEDTNYDYDDDNKRNDEDDDEKDEMAGGDNFGIVEEQRSAVPSDEEDVTRSENYEVDDEEMTEGEEEEEEEGKSSVKGRAVDKKGSEYWRNEEQNGRACVMRFSRLEDLIDHIKNNSPPTKLEETEYKLTLVKVDNKPIVHEIHDPEEEKYDEIVGDWNEFKETDYGKWILRGTKNTHDGVFPVLNRGKQQIPMCMIALAFASLYEVKKFNQKVVDTILMYGDRLHTLLKRIRSNDLKSNKDLGLTESQVEMMLQDVTFKINDYPKNMCMGEKLAKWETQLMAVSGDISSKIPEEIPNLEMGLEIFFAENIYGVLECRNYAVAVWKKDDFFYMFDPHAAGPSGIKSPVGVACITRYKNLDDIAKVFKDNLASYGDNFFEIHSFTFNEDKCERQRQPVEKEEKEPRLGGFAQVIAGKSILRGTVKLDCSKFSRGVNLHSPAIAYVALGVSIATNCQNWTRMVVNEILNLGEELYNDTVKKLGDKFNPWGDTLDIYRVNMDFRVGSLRANCALRFTEQRGIVDVKNNSKVPNLRQGLERFFLENTHGILVADKLVLAVWEFSRDEDTSIYVFDPNSRGATGLPTQEGVACVMKFVNAKVASDHIMACMVGMDKTKIKFAIVPVEVVVGASRSRRKIAKQEQPAKGIDLPVTCAAKKFEELEEKKAYKRMEEEKRRKEEAKKIMLFGREGMHKISTGQYILRGLRCMIANRDLPVNIVAFVFMKIASDLNKWTYKQIELILETGYQLYIDSFNAYQPDYQKLKIQHILRRVLLKDSEVKVDIKKPIVCNLFTKENLSNGLYTFFTKLNFCMLCYMEYLVSVYFKSGYYYLFDPYSRDIYGNKCENGCAMLMRFDNLEDLVDKVLKNLTDPGEEEVSRYALIVASIQGVQPLSQTSSKQAMRK